MKYIDFHVHAFDDIIAERAIAQLASTAGATPAKKYHKGDNHMNSVPHTNGTVSDTVAKLEEWDIDNAVILPIATKPAQQTIINNWASEVQKTQEKLFCFGTVHPDAEDALEELERIKSLGLHGIKLHPDYQNFFVEDEKLFPIYRKCEELGLPITFHAGFDPLSPNLVHATPQGFEKIIPLFPKLTFIIAHLGGMFQWDKFERTLAGKFENVYIDTAVVAGHIPEEQFLSIVRKQGVDKVLFATDCPWDCPQNEINLIESVDLSEHEKEMIYHLNAEKLLNI